LCQVGFRIRFLAKNNVCVCVCVCVCVFSSSVVCLSLTHSHRFLNTVTLSIFAATCQAVHSLSSLFNKTLLDSCGISYSLAHSLSLPNASILPFAAASSRRFACQYYLTNPVSIVFSPIP
jgi:uncharacterized membrane protein YgdD (TMEM256/DUF423 family)